jgi:hypothetical protein
VARGGSEVRAQGEAATPVLRRYHPYPTLGAPGQATFTVTPATATATSGATASPRPVTETPAPDPAYSNEERPLIVLAGFRVDPGRPAPGADFTLDLEVANRGERFAENVTLGLGGEAFLPVDAGAQVYWNSIDEGDSEGRSIRMRSGANLAAGVYPLIVTMRWDDSYGNSFSDTTSVGIAIGEGPSRPVVSVTGSRLPGRVAPGIGFQVALDVVNTGGTEARNLVAAALAGPLASVGSAGTGPVTLAPGSATTIVVSLMAASPAQPGATSQAIELRYDSPTGERYTENHIVGVHVSGDAAYGPLPMVAGYRITSSSDEEAATLAPGEVFDLALDIQNVGATAALRTRLSLGAASSSGGSAAASAGSGPFAPVGTGSTRFLASIDPGATITVEQRMVVAGDAKPGVYTLPLAFMYVDADGEEHDAGELITLLVARSVSISINPLDPITTTFVGTPLRFAAEIVNGGDGVAKIGDVEVVGSRSIRVEDGRRFVGQLDAGALDVIEATLVPRAPGESTVTVVVHYTDDFNQARTLEEEFALTIEDAPAMDEQPIAPESSKRSGNPIVRVIKGLLGIGASGPGEDEPDEPEGVIGEPALDE